ncbi:protein FAM200C-like [Lepeophtheirus salmonis]|uniref:protein FAM200C-like n=1 Tax=Lepeophtheirus salmonis TaxID=72036 RepID=UPI003AF37AD8
MANVMLGKAAEDKFSQIPLSNDTISSRINDMSNDILAQVVADLISSPAKFSLQLDETTDVSNLSQLVVFVRYMKEDVIKEYFLFCKSLTTTTKAVDVKKLGDDFLKGNNLSWNMVSVVCSDGAPAMLGRHSGFGALVKSDAPHIIVTHCILHRHALATKTLPPKVAQVLKVVVEYVTFVRNSALKHRIFKELCKEMGTEFEVHLYHSNVRWLSRGKVLNRVFAMRMELALFLREYGHCHADSSKILSSFSL